MRVSLQVGEKIFDDVKAHVVTSFLHLPVEILDQDQEGVDLSIQVNEGVQRSYRVYGTCDNPVETASFEIRPEYLDEDMAHNLRLLQALLATQGLV